MGALFLALPFLCALFCRAFFRARARMYAHTNEIIDIYLIILYIYRKQVCKYSKAKKRKKANEQRKARKAKRETTTQRQNRERNKNEQGKNEKKNAKK